MLAPDKGDFPAVNLIVSDLRSKVEMVVQTTGISSARINYLFADYDLIKVVFALYT